MNASLVKLEAADYSSLKCGGPLYRVLMPQNETEIVDFCQKYYGEQKQVLGGLTNTLILSGGDDKLCISTKSLKGITVDDNIIVAKCGESLAKVAQVAQYYCLSGMENICSIPGTIGGAVFGNSGSFGCEISEIVESVKVIDLDTGIIEHLYREEIGFFYRKTNFRKNKDFIYSISLKLYPKPCNEIALKMNEYKKKRQLLQPKKPSLGSVFKKCDNVGAGYYLEQAGLKGYVSNGMKFSDEHANFIVNIGGNAEDYLALMELGEKVVFEKFGKNLIREVKVIGEPANKKFNRN